MYVIRVVESDGTHTTLRFADSEPDNAWYVWDQLTRDGEPARSMTMHDAAGALLSSWEGDS